jgi:Flp pilus assembly protein TadD
LRLAALATTLMLMMVLTWAACGGTAQAPISTNALATPSGTYSLTVTGTYTATGTNAQIVHNSTLTLTVH